MAVEARITGLTARAYTIPTDRPEADGTQSWTKTTLVLVEVNAGGKTGLGYSYADACIAGLVNQTLAQHVVGGDALDVRRHWLTMRGAVRNLGRSGLAACAIAAIDTALWDLKARLLDLPLVSLLGAAREAVPIYGSGGFTSYDDATLQRQLAGWVETEGCRAVKMKIGSEPERDPARVRAARAAIGAKAALFVDANGAFTPGEALGMAHRLAGQSDICWLEEPVSSDDLAGLAEVRAGSPPGLEIAAGEYSYTEDDARRTLAAEAVDVQQADITRCAGLTGFLDIAALSDAHHRDLSGHCAPSLHLHAACAVSRFRHLEWFHDHVRIEHMFFEGAPIARNGLIRPDLARPGHGLAFKQADAAPFAV